MDRVLFDVVRKHVSKHMRYAHSVVPEQPNDDDDAYFLRRFLLLEFLQSLPQINVVVIEATIRNLEGNKSDWTVSPLLYNMTELTQEGDKIWTF